MPDSLHLCYGGQVLQWPASSRCIQLQQQSSLQSRLAVAVPGISGCADNSGMKVDWLG